MQTLKKLFPLFLIVIIPALMMSQDKGDKGKKDSYKNNLEQQVSDIFKQHCAGAGCHQGSYPKKGLNLEPDKFKESLLDKPSRQAESMKLVDTENPQDSYLLVKVKGGERLIDSRMPEDAPPLIDEEIQAIENWIKSVSNKNQSAKTEADSSKKPNEK